MKAFTSVTGIAAPLLRANVDTDAIIPSREMKRVSKEGLSEGLFAGWRYTTPGSRQPRADFVLNRPPFDEASILLAGPNFGCGSSREHAVWALAEWGITAIVAPGFGSIFRANCVRNGILPVVLDRAAVEQIAAAVEQDPIRHKLTIDLREKRVILGEDTWTFDLPEEDRQMLLHGLDPIALTLASESDIAAFEARDRAARPWARL